MQENIRKADFEQLLKQAGSSYACAEKLVTDLEKEELLLECPAYLTEQILERVKQPDIQVPVAIKRTSKQLQLLLYSLKVGAAVAVALLMLMATTDVQSIEGYSRQVLDFEQITAQITEKAELFKEIIISGGIEQ